MSADTEKKLDPSSMFLVGRVQAAAVAAMSDGRGEAVADAVGLGKVFAALGPLLDEWHRTVTREQILKACALLGLSDTDAETTWSLFAANRRHVCSSCAEHRVNAAATKGQVQ